MRREPDVLVSEILEGNCRYKGCKFNKHGQCTDDFYMNVEWEVMYDDLNPNSEIPCKSCECDEDECISCGRTLKKERERDMIGFYVKYCRNGCDIE